MNDSETEDLELDISNGPENGNQEQQPLEKDNFATTPTQKKMLRLPLARVKNMMKLDPECCLTSQDSVFLVTKATEMFIEYLAIEACKNLDRGKRKTVLKRDVDSAIENHANLCFLDGALE